MVDHAESHDVSRALVRKIVVSALLVMLFIGGGVAVAVVLYLGKPTVEARKPEKALLNVDVFEVTECEFQELLTGFGTSRAEREGIVAAQVTGEITEIHPQLKVGSSVQAASVDAQQCLFGFSSFDGWLAKVQHNGHRNTATNKQHHQQCRNDNLAHQSA